MTNPTIFNQLLIWPILNLLVFLYKLFLSLGVPGAFGLAIIGLTILIRFLLNPLMGAQLKGAQKAQELKPRIDELAKKYAQDKTRLQQEQLKLYKEAGVNPASGCLLLILQMPVIIALYNVFWQILTNGNLEKMLGEINQIVYFPFLKLATLDLGFFGLNLASKPSDWQKLGWWLLLIPVVTAVLQWYQTKLMAPAVAKAENKKEEPGQEDMAKTMQSQMSILFPLMIGWFAYSFPVGLSLYWNTFTILGIIQQKKIQTANVKTQKHD